MATNASDEIVLACPTCGNTNLTEEAININCEGPIEVVQEKGRNHYRNVDPDKPLELVVTYHCANAHRFTLTNRKVNGMNQMHFSVV